MGFASPRDLAVPVMQPKTLSPVASLERLSEVHSSGVFSNFGPQVQFLERKFAEILGVNRNQVVVSANATLALQGAITVSKAPEWRAPSWTFAATGMALKASGLPFEFVDISPDTWSIEVDGGAESPTGHLLVLPFGASLNLATWHDETEVVVDAAASFGSMCERFPSLPLKTTIIFSLHATKVLGVGEGALSVFGDPDRALEFRRWSNFRFSGSRVSTSYGTNAKMSEYIAALLITELENWHSIRSDWARARALADQASDTLGLQLQPMTKGLIGPYWVVLFRDHASRELAERSLSDARIGSRRWWAQGLHQMPAFETVRFENLRHTEEIASRYLGLPMYRDLNLKAVDRIMNVLQPLL